MASSTLRAMQPILFRALVLTLFLATLSPRLASAQEAPAPDAVPVPPVQTEALPPQPPREFRGAAVALDGMSLRIGEERVVLYGILVPDLSRTEGLRARLALDRLIAGRSDIACLEAPRDAPVRKHAICKSGETDFAEALLMDGIAIVDRAQTHAVEGEPEVAQRYDAAEAAARQLGKGAWIDFAEPPAPPVPTRNERLLALAREWQAGIGSLLGVLIVGFVALLTCGLRRRPVAPLAQHPAQPLPPPPVSE